MPKTRRPRPLYQRGNYRLDKRPDRENLQITFYDPVARRERITSAGTRDIDVAKRALDTLYSRNTAGESICPTCGQPRIGQGSALVTDVIANYLLAHAGGLDSEDAIKYRLTHVLNYIATLARIPRCDEIDNDWIEGFRRWFAKVPIVSKLGKVRQRSLSTIENSVLQLAAAINWGKSKGHTLHGAQFRPIATTKVNRTPEHRSDLAELIRMFEYATEPTRKNRRLNLLRFLRISVVTLARPDAAHDFTTKKEKAQWNSAKRVLNLNPKGRQQTKKFRPVVPIIEPFAQELDETDGPYITVNSVKSAFETMADDLGLPKDGESGMKLIRRSMGDLLRARLPKRHWTEIELFLGHDTFNETSGIYAPFRPDYLAVAKQEIQKIVNIIEKAVPGAFYRTVTAQKPALRVVNGSGNG